MKKDFKKLTIKVKEIKGICPVYKPGEKIVIDGGGTVVFEVIRG